MVILDNHTILILIFAPILSFMPFLIFILWYQAKNRRKFREKGQQIARFLSDNDFVVSRIIGHYDRFNATASFYLYIDEVNKKWLMTSPMSGDVGKIRSYSDVIAFDFFDEDDNTWVKKMDDKTKSFDKAIFGSIGAIVGYMVGDLLGGWRGGIVGAIGGGMGLIKLNQLLHNNPQGVTGSYGIILKIADNDIENTCIIFDFLMVEGKTAGKAIKAPRLMRKLKIYKKDIEVISEMLNAFECMYMQMSA